MRKTLQEYWPRGYHSYLNLFHTQIFWRGFCGRAHCNRGRDFRGPTCKSKLPDPGRSCQQSFVFNLQKKKAKLTVKLWDHYSFLHFIRNGTTSAENDWSWFGEKIGYNIWKLQRLSFFLTSVATLKLVTLMSLWRVFTHSLFLYQAEISLVRCIHSIDFWQVNNLRVNTYCNPHTCTTAFFSSTKQATRLFIKTRIGIRRFPKWNFLEGVYSLGCLWIVGGLGPSEISAKVTNKKRFS